MTASEVLLVGCVVLMIVLVVGAYYLSKDSISEEDLRRARINAWMDREFGEED